MIDLIVDESEIELEAGESGIELDVSEQFIEGGGGANLQPNKTVAPSTSQVEVRPDAGYDGLEKVTVEAMPEGLLAVPNVEYNDRLGVAYIDIEGGVEDEGYIDSASGYSYPVRINDIPNLPKQSSVTVTPTTVEQTVVEAKKWVVGPVKVAPIPSEYIVPSGAKNIAENGTHDVANYAFANVAVPASAVDTGAKSITANGTYNVVGYASANVQVPASAVDSGTKTINSNGTHNVVGYASAKVNVPNSYSALDEGKVVQSGALVSQSSQTVADNGTYNTTTKNSITVAIPSASGVSF